MGILISLDCSPIYVYIACLIQKTEYVVNRVPRLGLYLSTAAIRPKFACCTRSSKGRPVHIYPFGIERCILYVNHSDILEKLHYFLDYDELHSKWMERKYGDYLVYYKYYRADLRSDMNDIRKQIFNAKNRLDNYALKLKNFISLICAITGIGIGITAFLTQQWLAVPGAVIFVLVAVYMFKKKD